MKKVFLLCFLAFSACMPTPKPNSPVGSEVQIRRQVIAALQERNRKIRSLKGLVSVRYGTTVFGPRGEAAVLILSPKHLRVDGLSEMGPAGSELVLRDGKLTIYWEGDNRFHEGEADAEEMERFLKVPLDPESVIGVMLGKAPLKKAEDYPFILMKDKKIVLKGRRGELTVVSKGPSWVPVQYEEFDSEGRLRALAVYDDYLFEKNVGKRGVWFPRKISIRLENAGSTKSVIELNYHDLEFNPVVKMSLFQLKIPKNATPVD
jgi:hypothetical protein